LDEEAKAGEEIDPSQIQDLNESSIFIEPEDERKGLFGDKNRGIQGINVEELQLRAMV